MQNAFSKKVKKTGDNVITEENKSVNPLEGMKGRARTGTKDRKAERNR
jgi:hypothetical protein